MRIKIHGGVVGGDSRGLCASCENGHTREFANNNVEIWCDSWSYGGSAPQQIRHPVTRCTEYRATGSVSQEALEKIAWNITTDKRTGKIGFVTPADRAQTKDND